MGLITAVGLSSVFGWIFIVALASLMTDIPYLLDPGNDAGGYAVAQALYDAFHRRYALVTVLFSLPVAYPVAADNFNYAPVLVGGVMFLCIGSWVLHARFWFQGPITNVDL
nr:unnamed protein product [Digitaria exilis]